MPTSTLLLIHVGPVQDFIASARKCRDLWFGSQLLSDLSAVVARAVVEASGLREDEALIFPGSLTPREDGASAVANKIQVYLKGLSLAQAEAVANAGKTAMQDELKRRSDEAFAQVRQRVHRPDRDFELERAQEHISSMMEFMWAALSTEQALEQDNTAYRMLRSQLEELLAARKNTLSWSQRPAVRGGIPKSSLDGVRESVIAEEVYDRYQSAALHHVFKIHSTERLCGVGLFKRVGSAEDDGEIPSFHSTSHIASAPTRQRIHASPMAQQAWMRLYDALDGVGVDVNELRVRAHQDDAAALRVRPGAGWGIDGVALYPSRVAARGQSGLMSRLRRSNDDAAEHDAAEQEIQRAQRALLQALGLQEPFAYYALLLADGDKMGVALDALGDLRAHREFSRALDERFSSRCAEIVRAHQGSLIYAGGDDVLALLPVHTALDCAYALNAKFRAAMQRCFQGTNIAPPTLSAGLAIAHHQEMLGSVRDLAKVAEKMAKTQGRDSLAIAVRKRNNDPLFLCDRWDGPQGGASPRARIERWSELLSTRGLPRGLAHRLEDLISPLALEHQHTALQARGAAAPSLGVGLEDICRALVLQTLNQKDIDAAHARELLTELFERAQQQTQDPIRSVRQMAHELRISQLFFEAQRHAQGEDEQ